MITGHFPSGDFLDGETDAVLLRLYHDSDGSGLFRLVYRWKAGQEIEDMETRLANHYAPWIDTTIWVSVPTTVDEGPKVDLLTLPHMPTWDFYASAGALDQNWTWLRRQRQGTRVIETMAWNPKKRWSDGP